MQVILEKIFYIAVHCQEPKPEQSSNDMAAATQEHQQGTQLAQMYQSALAERKKLVRQGRAFSGSGFTSSGQ